MDVQSHPMAGTVKISLHAPIHQPGLVPGLLEAIADALMDEGTVHPVPDLADRFLLRVRMGYPNPSEEMRVLSEQQVRHPIESLKPVVKVNELLDAIEEIRQVYVSPTIQRYIIDLVGRTRQSGDVYLGASPRGSLALFRAGQARAALQGRDHVLPDDIKALAVPVLGHRVIVSPAARLRELSADRIVQEIVYTAPVPGGDYQASAAAASSKVKVEAQ